VEAIANGVSAFENPQPRNARVTLAWLGALACALFLGVSTLAVWTGARPSDHTSVLAQVAKAVFGGSAGGRVAFLLVQASTLAVLCLAANASFQGFPRLTALMAHDRYAPRQFENLGDRLVYSNGVLVLGLLAVVMIVVYQANVSSLIHLYVVGVFCAFTLSQTGMVRHWWREHGTRWRRSIAINSVGAAATGVVASVVIWTKFAEGAWMVVVAVPFLVLVFRGINRHYRDLRRRLDVGVSGVVDAPAFETTPLVVVERSDGATRHALWLARTMAHSGDAEAIAIGASCGRALASDLRAEKIHVGRRAARRDLTEAVRESVWALPHGGSRFVTVILPEQFERP
jgi:amino acid transporter